MSANGFHALSGIDDGDGLDRELAHALESYLAAVEAGRHVDLERLAAEHPAIADQLRSCLDVLRLAGQVEGDAGTSPSRDVGDGLVQPTQLGDFRLLRPIGRGGMGIVYEAEQVSLHRRVALKILPFAAALDPHHLQRFQTEAKAAAHLHHTNIVPVFSVGCERGVYYYAMQFIEGQTLAALIRDLRRLEGFEENNPARPTAMGLSLTDQVVSGRLAPPPPPPPASVAAHDSAADRSSPSTQIRPASSSTPSTRSRAFFRTVAQFGIQAAEALDYAHRMGIVHRDVKPANLLVDIRSNLWITDFGLARMQTDNGLTLTGDVIGTLRYMSPEQALSRRAVIDHRTDIYSLVVTLYELLVLQPAFSGRDREELLRQLTLEEPRSPRRLNSAVPVDLETIILKAMSKEPESRYATAQDLADDLRRFLELKPIRARRPNHWDRLVKWTRRHTAVVASAVIVLTLAVLGLAISTALIAAKQVEIALQRNQAQRQTEKARRIIDEMYTGLSERWLAQDPGDAELRREFLDKAAAYYEEFARTPGQSPEVRLEAAHAWLRVGMICWSLRRVPEGELAYRHAIELFGVLGNDSHIDPLAALDGEVYATDRLGDLLWVAGRDGEADVLYSHTIDLSRSILARCPDHAAAWINLGAAQLSLGDLRNDPSIIREAEGTFRKLLTDLIARRADTQPVAEQLLKHRIVVDLNYPSWAIAAVASGVEAHQAILPGVYEKLGEALTKLERFTEAEGCFRQALAVLPAPSGDGRYHERRAYTFILHNLAVALAMSGRYREAKQAYRDAMELVPNDPKVNAGLAWLLAICPDAKVRDPREAIRLARRVTDLTPGNGHVWQALGIAYYRVGEWAAAVRALDRTMALREGGDATDKLFMAMTQWRLGHHDQARSWYERGVSQIHPSANPAHARSVNPMLETHLSEAAGLLGLSVSPKPRAIEDVPRRH